MSDDERKARKKVGQAMRSEWKKRVQASKVRDQAKNMAMSQAAVKGMSPGTLNPGSLQPLTPSATEILAKLPVYDEQALCSKCGYATIDTMWQEMRLRGRSDAGFLLRTCGRCAYQWRERSLDEADPLEVLAVEGKKG